MIRVPSMACGVQGKAEFFVTVGVLSLLVCLVSLPVYLFKTEYYENNTWLPMLVSLNLFECSFSTISVKTTTEQPTADARKAASVRNHPQLVKCSTVD